MVAERDLGTDAEPLDEDDGQQRPYVVHPVEDGQQGHSGGEVVELAPPVGGGHPDVLQHGVLLDEDLQPAVPPRGSARPVCRAAGASPRAVRRRSCPRARAVRHRSAPGASGPSPGLSDRRGRADPGSRPRRPPGGRGCTGRRLPTARARACQASSGVQPERAAKSAATSAARRGPTATAATNSPTAPVTLADRRRTPPSAPGCKKYRRSPSADRSDVGGSWSRVSGVRSPSEVCSPPST